MRLWRSQRSSWASSKTLAIVIISRAPGAAATKYWKAEERAEQAHRRAAAELLGEPLLERQVGVDRDRPQVVGELDLGLALDALALEGARHALLLRRPRRRSCAGRPRRPRGRAPRTTVVLPTPPLPVT